MHVHSARSRPRRAPTPRPGRWGTRRQPSASTRTGSASMKSRRSAVQPGGSNGNSTNGPPPTPHDDVQVGEQPDAVRPRVRGEAAVSVRAAARPACGSRRHAEREDHVGLEDVERVVLERCAAARRSCAPSRRRRSARRSARAACACRPGRRPAAAPRPTATSCSASRSTIARRVWRRRARARVAGHPPPLVEVDEDLHRRRRRASRTAATPRRPRRRGRGRCGPSARGSRASRSSSACSARACRGAELAQRGVGRQPVDGAAEQRRARDAERLPGDVAERGLERPAAAGVELDRRERPDVPGDPQRVLADEQATRRGRSRRSGRRCRCRPAPRRCARGRAWPRRRVRGSGIPGGAERRVELERETFDGDRR